MSALGIERGRRASSRWVAVARVLGALAASTIFASAGCAGPKPVAETRPGVGCDLTSTTWRQTSPGPCGASKWTFTRNNVDGRYRAKESGCANATGVAAYDGSTIVVQFQSGRGGGVYTWPLDGQCRGGAGTVTWTAGDLMGQTVASTLAPP